jgi:membrane-associated protease RseP (regulator of RpoE activity)
MAAPLLGVIALAIVAPQISGAGGTPPTTAPASYLHTGDHRIAAVVYRLASRGTAYCGAPHPLTGMALHHLEDYAKADEAEAAKQYGLDKGPAVLAVVAESPAARAGVQAGDVLLSVNGTRLPARATASGRRKPRQLANEVDALIEREARTGGLRFEALRGAQPLSLTLKPVFGCPARGRLARSNQPNAFADGRYAIMTTKMLDFVSSDDELAVVMAHELAHNILGHPQRLDAQKVPHGILRGFGKNAGRVRVTEEEADRLSLRLLWAAGYDVSAAIPFWRRLYARYDPIPIPKFMRTHPSLGARERMIRQAIEELGARPRG